MIIDFNTKYNNYNFCSHKKEINVPTAFAAEPNLAKIICDICRYCCWMNATNTIATIQIISDNIVYYIYKNSILLIFTDGKSKYIENISISNINLQSLKQRIEKFGLLL